MHTCDDSECACLPKGDRCANPDKYVELLRTTPARTVCPNFYILDHARGCNFNCSYCFLKDTEFDRKERRIYDDKERLFAEMKSWIARDGLETYLANSGNRTDSLSFEKSRPLWGELIEFMRENAERKGRPHCLLVVTKAGLSMCGAFLEHRPTPNIIVSFSINAPEAAKRHEIGAASTKDRLAAAAKLRELGWRVRVRIDPMIKGYDYSWVADEVRKMRPERVTLGTLRADPTLIPEVAGIDIFRGLEEPEPDSIARYPLAERLDMYRSVIAALGTDISVGLCEETEDVWKALELDFEHKTCNCNPL